METTAEVIHFGWHRGSYTPVPSEIRAKRLEIQERWSEAERRRRAAWMFQAEEVAVPMAIDADEGIEF